MAPREHNAKSKGSVGCSGLYAIAAFGCIIAATVVCNFVTVTGTITNTNEQGTLQRGIWKGQDFIDDTCDSGYLSNTYLGSRWKAAQAMSIIACFCGGMAIWPLVCACGKEITLKTVGGVAGNCFWGCLFSGLTLLMLTSEACVSTELTNSTCKLDTGANLAISATVLFFVASIAMSCSVVVAGAAQVLEEQEGDVEKGGEEGAEKAKEEKEVGEEKPKEEE